MSSQINLRSIPAFKDISERSIKSIQDSAEYIKYNMGSPILRGDTIPNSILIILTGRARLIPSKSLTKNSTLILNPDNFIGLQSLLCANACEEIFASTDLLVMSISDNLILDLYKEESSFKNWCDSKIKPSEIYNLVNILEKNNSNITND